MKYFARRRILWCEDDVFWEERNNSCSMTVEEPARGDIDIGLLDSSGNKIYRRTERVSFGFQPPTKAQKND